MDDFEADSKIPDEDFMENNKTSEELCNGPATSNCQDNVQLCQTSDDDEVLLNFSNRGSRKRKLNTKSWKKFQKKSKINKGLKYSSTNGKTMQSRNSPIILTKCCGLQCFTKFLITDLEKINTNYWALGEYSRQRDFIKYNVRSKDCERVKKGGDSKRQITNVYFLDEKKVCKKMFLSTLNIGAKVIQIVKEKEAKKLDVGLDRRGGDTNSVSSEDREIVKSHIKSFPVVESHYCRSSTRRLYFYSGLNQTKLYELYVNEVGVSR